MVARICAAVDSSARRFRGEDLTSQCDAYYTGLPPEQGQSSSLDEELKGLVSYETLVCIDSDSR